MNVVSAIHELYAFENGDTITPGMGVSIAEGHALAQYFDTAVNKVIETDFTRFPPTLYPQPYSSAMGSIVVPETVGQQWYYNNINEASAILDDNGTVKEKFQTLFEKTTINSNGKVFPALKIKGNLATASNITSKQIFYCSSWDGKAFTCSQMIPIQAAVGNTYRVLLSYQGPDGANGDSVISDKGDYVKVTAYLQQSGQNVEETTFSFQKLDGSIWKDISSQSGLYTVTANSIKIEEAAVDGIETFRAVAAFGTQRYYEPFQISDIQDIYYIVDGCSIDGDAVAPNTDVSFAPEVYVRTTNQRDDNAWAFDYQVLKRADNSLLQSKNGSSMTVDYSTIKSNNGVRVRIHATKS